MKKMQIFAAVVLGAATLAFENIETRHEDHAVYGSGLIAAAHSAVAPVQLHHMNSAMRLSCLLPKGVVMLLIATGSLNTAVICRAEL